MAGPSRDDDATRSRAATGTATLDEGETQFRASDEAETRLTQSPAAATHERTLQRTLRASADEPLQAGMRLRDRYVLEAPIGRGAMGEVWKARDLLSEEARDRNPYVAIKVLLSDVERHPQAFAAMHREASRTQRLAHPNIVTVYTLDRDDASGRAFIAMELLDGEPLDKLIRRMHKEGAVVKDPWSIIRGLAEGLAYAHRKGIVHSDFKPGNVFLTKEGVPKILDFGIARAARSGDEEHEADYDDSVISGYTERYAAPEVLEDAPPHTSDDVFALGLVAYELLTGEHALGRKTSLEARASGSQPALIKTIKRRERRILARALAYERKERWRDAGAFLQALQRSARLQIALAASLAALVLTAAGLSWKNHLDSLPTVPFEQLPPSQQDAVRKALGDGEEALRYVREAQLIEASADAADRFAAAYALHVRNPDAVRGLEAAADHFIAWWEKEPDRARALEELRKFQEKSEFYRGYGPLEAAIRARSDP